MKFNIKENELISILQKYNASNGIITKSEALKALENGSRAADDQFFLWKLGDDIKDIRKSRGISQRQLAKRLNTSPANLRRIEKGERSVSVVNLYRILKALNSDYNINPDFGGIDNSKLIELLDYTAIKTNQNLDMDVD